MDFFSKKGPQEKKQQAMNTPAASGYQRARTPDAPPPRGLHAHQNMHRGRNLLPAFVDRPRAQTEEPIWTRGNEGSHKSSQ